MVICHKAHQTQNDAYCCVAPPREAQESMRLQPVRLVRGCARRSRATRVSFDSNAACLARIFSALAVQYTSGLALHACKCIHHEEACVSPTSSTALKTRQRCGLTCSRDSVCSNSPGQVLQPLATMVAALACTFNPQASICT